MLDTNTRISDIVWLPRGQTVAAQVPYTKRKQEWIVASVVSWNEDEMTYVVKDEFPENKKMKSWTIPHHKVIRFPRDVSDPIIPGDRVLSLWYIPDTEEWSSMFYEATIVNADDIDKHARVWLRFNGDDEVYEIDSMKIVKPKRRSKVPKRPFSTSNGSYSPLHSPLSDAFEDRPHRTSSPPEQPLPKRQRVKLEMEDHPPRNGMDSGMISSSYSKSFAPSITTAASLNNGSNNNRAVSPEREHPPTPVSAAMFNNRYQFCGVLGKKMKRMGAILNERSKVSNA